MLKLVSQKEVDIDEIEFPKILYKYRKWTDDFHKTILTRREVYFASPSSFEDEYDCKIPIRYDLLSEVDVYNHYLLNSKELHKHMTRQQHRQYAREWVKKSLIKDKKFIQKKQKEEFDEYDKRFGVLSLTEDIFNNEMWRYYSDKSKGFAIGFDPSIMFPLFGGGDPVEYYDELPIIFPRPIHSFELQIRLQNYSKLKKWQFEKEYRTNIFKPIPMTNVDRIIQIPSHAFKEIIIGADMEESMMKDLINNIPEELKNITVKQAKIINGKIEIKKLSKFNNSVR